MRQLITEAVPFAFDKCLADVAVQNWADNIQNDILQVSMKVSAYTCRRYSAAVHMPQNDISSLRHCNACAAFCSAYAAICTYSYSATAMLIEYIFAKNLMHVYGSASTKSRNPVSQACLALAELTVMRLQRYATSVEYDSEEEEELLVRAHSPCSKLMRTPSSNAACALAQQWQACGSL